MTYSAVDFAREVYPAGTNAFETVFEDTGSLLLNGQVGALIASGKTGELYKKMLTAKQPIPLAELTQGLEDIRDTLVREMYGIPSDVLQNAPDQLRKVYEDLKNRLLDPLTAYQTFRRGPAAMQELLGRLPLEAAQQRLTASLVAPVFTATAYNDSLSDDQKQKFMDHFKGDPQRLASTLAQELSAELGRLVERTLEERLHM